MASRASNMRAQARKTVEFFREQEDTTVNVLITRDRLDFSDMIDPWGEDDYNYSDSDDEGTGISDQHNPDAHTRAKVDRNPTRTALNRKQRSERALVNLRHAAAAKRAQLAAASAQKAGKLNRFAALMEEDDEPVAPPVVATSYRQRQFLELSDPTMMLIFQRLVPTARRHFACTCSRLHQVAQIGLAQLQRRTQQFDGTFLPVLPDDVLVTVFMYLSPLDLHNCAARLSRLWYQWYYHSYPWYEQWRHYAAMYGWPLRKDEAFMTQLLRNLEYQCYVDYFPLPGVEKRPLGRRAFMYRHRSCFNRISIIDQGTENQRFFGVVDMSRYPESYFCKGSAQDRRRSQSRIPCLICKRQVYVWPDVTLRWGLYGATVVATCGHFWSVRVDTEKSMFLPLRNVY
eukprot:TRINITY_DN6024_c0_g1_i1.p1 TRINITY_DN6024_c0_g1~~TRINITY_DN6024_c0_g1_i1.p1  ORF type:complete len:400 (+),score=53.34 TRINITY_DN6024_c0_g1_i1:71-1270(+)